jgi:hypothetical protein
MRQDAGVILDTPTDGLLARERQDGRARVGAAAKDRESADDER